MEKKISNKKCLYLFVVLILLLLFYFTWHNFGFLLASNDLIFTGVSVQNINLSDLNKSQVVQKLLVLQKQIAQEKMILTVLGREKEITLHDLAVQININQTIDQAISIGRKGSIWQKWHQRNILKSKGINITPIVFVNEKKLKTVVDNFVGNRQIKAEDAQFVINQADKVQIKPEKIGLSVDMQDLLNQIIANVDDKTEHQLILKFAQIKPKVTASYLQSININSLMAGFTTYFDAGATNRVYNINVASDAFNDLLVSPGETISFNKVVGPRDANTSFKEAPVIINDEVVDGLGGGICQVSTTLYNSVLLANLSIIERTNHSLPVGYVPLGRDATVDFGNIDLKFKNNTGNYLLIKTQVQGNSLTFKIFGNGAVKKNVEIETILAEVYAPKVIYEDDQGLEQGKEVIKQEGNKGYYVRSYRIIKENGQPIKREELTISKYNPQNRIIAVGKKIVNIFFPVHIN